MNVIGEPVDELGPIGKMLSAREANPSVDLS